MLTLLIFSLVCSLGYQIPHNLEMNILKITLEKGSIPASTPEGLDQFYRDLTFNQFIHFRVKHFLVENFQNPNVTNSTIPSQQRQLTFNGGGWSADENGTIVPPWHPKDFSTDFLHVLDDPLMYFISRSSEVAYFTTIQIGDTRKQIDMQISTSISDNMLLSTDCKNCSEQGDTVLLDPETYCISPDPPLPPLSYGESCDGTAWIKMYELIDQRAMVNFSYVLLNHTSVKLHGGGILSLLPKNNIASGLMDAHLIEKEAFGIHYQNDDLTNDGSYIVFGGNEEFGNDEVGYEHFNLKVYKDKYILPLEGLSIRKGGVKPKSIYGLQDYDTFLDESIKYISFPLPLLIQFRDNFAEMGVYCYIDTEYTIGTMICDRESSHYPIITLILNGKEIALDPKIYGDTLIERFETPLYLTNFAVNLQGRICLGEPFFKSNFLYFDLENKKMGITYPNPQTLMDWSLFDNKIVMFSIIALFAGLIIVIILCVKEDQKKRESFSQFNDDKGERVARTIDIEMRKD